VWLLSICNVAVAQAPARLIVTRSPNVGANIIVQLSIDGQIAPAITYGRSYKVSLSPGRHVLGVSPIPNAIWKHPTAMSVDMQPGHTYWFTVINNGSGHLQLVRGR
jgi:hypothetical protein